MTQGMMGGTVPLGNGGSAAMPPMAANGFADHLAGLGDSASRRYAIYFAPKDDSTLARFGGWWLGRRPGRREFGALPSVGLARDLQSRMVAEPRRYGFHATLKAPFRLTPDVDRAGLCDALAEFAGRRRSFVEPPLVLDTRQGYLSLVPSRDSGAIAELAAGCVREFDSFRAPCSPEEIRRRRAGGLSPYEEKALMRWGYPFVFDAFCFHMTLTGQLDETERGMARDAVAPLLAQVFNEPVVFSSVCLFEQAGDGEPFILAERFWFRS